VNQQESVWGFAVLIALARALISAIAATVSVGYEMSRFAWGWTASFVLSSVVAA
jgi:hypothetical protein